jgi:hypothetical protein
VIDSIAREMPERRIEQFGNAAIDLSRRAYDFEPHLLAQ